MIDFPSNPTIGQRFTAKNKTWEWDGTAWIYVPTTPAPSEEWVRPAEWMPMPEISPTEDKFAGLIAVFDTDANYVELKVDSTISDGVFGFTVDWGDGVVEEYPKDEKGSVEILAEGEGSRFSYTLSEQERSDLISIDAIAFYIEGLPLIPPGDYTYNPTTGTITFDYQIETPILIYTTSYLLEDAGLQMQEGGYLNLSELVNERGLNLNEPFRLFVADGGVEVSNSDYTLVGDRIYLDESLTDIYFVIRYHPQIKTAVHQYNFANLSLTDTSESLGYKQAMVVVTPQEGSDPWTYFSLQEGVIPGSIWSAPVNWLDIVFSGPNVTELKIGLED